MKTPFSIMFQVCDRSKTILHKARIKWGDHSQHAKMLEILNFKLARLEQRVEKD
jgi:hypothetical protein